MIEFLKSLQMLPPGTRDLVVDEQAHGLAASAVGTAPPALRITEMG